MRGSYESDWVSSIWGRFCNHFSGYMVVLRSQFFITSRQCVLVSAAFISSQRSIIFTGHCQEVSRNVIGQSQVACRILTLRQGSVGGGFASDQSRGNTLSGKSPIDLVPAPTIKTPKLTAQRPPQYRHLSDQIVMSPHGQFFSRTFRPSALALSPFVEVSWYPSSGSTKSRVNPSAI